MIALIILKVIIMGKWVQQTVCQSLSALNNGRMDNVSLNLTNRDLITTVMVKFMVIKIQVRPTTDIRTTAPQMIKKHQVLQSQVRQEQQPLQLKMK